MKKLLGVFCLLILLFTVVLVGAPLQAQSDVTTFNSVMANNFWRALPRSAITVTDNGTINATGTHQRLTAAGAVGTSGDNLAIKPAGSILVLVNTGSNTITITETANIKSAGNIVLGALDTATLVSDGVDWYQISGSNN